MSVVDIKNVGNNCQKKYHSNRREEHHFKVSSVSEERFIFQFLERIRQIDMI